MTKYEELMTNGMTSVEAIIALSNEGIEQSDINEMVTSHSNKDNRNYKIVQYIRNHRDSGLSRRKLAINMEAQGLCKESSAFHYLSMLPIIDEYVKQEIDG